LEHIAEKIAAASLEHDMVQAVTVRIRKPHIALPIALEFLGIEITRRRDDLK
jgi:dihydroneopterin aldolase